MEFGKRLKELRIKTGLSQEELAYKINEQVGGSIKRNTISNYENDVSKPDYDTLIAITTILNITTDQILARSDELLPALQEEPTKYHASEFQSYLNTLEDRMKEIQNKIQQKSTNKVALEGYLKEVLIKMDDLIIKAEELHKRHQKSRKKLKS